MDERRRQWRLPAGGQRGELVLAAWSADIRGPRGVTGYPAPTRWSQDVQWKLVKPLFDPNGRRAPKARHSRRRMVEAVLWLARTGCQWRDLPPRYGP